MLMISKLWQYKKLPINGQNIVSVMFIQLLSLEQ